MEIPEEVCASVDNTMEGKFKDYLCKAADQGYSFSDLRETISKLTYDEMTHMARNGIQKPKSLENLSEIADTLLKNAEKGTYLIDGTEPNCPYIFSHCKETGEVSR